MFMSNKFEKEVEKVQQEGKYFLLDRDEVDPSLDQFQFNSIVENILRVVVENKPPYVVGIFGSWGTGKSTVANFLKKRLLNLDKDIRWVQVSVWNHNPVNLPQASYRELMKSLGKTGIEVTNELTTKITHTDIEPKGFRDKFTKDFKAMCLTLVPFGAVYALTVLFGYSIFTSITSYTFNLEQLGLVAGKYGWMPFMIALAKFLLDRLKSFEIKREVGPLTSIDQYAEKFLEETKGKRVFVLIDDLDRLAPKKIVQALEVMKTYMNTTNENCVFIVPCDDHILREAVEEVKSLDEPDGGKYLEKFFQFTFRLPAHQNNDLKKFANNVLQKVNSPLLRLPDFDTIIPILIYPDVKTPRHVKKLINEYSSLFGILSERENGMIPLIPKGDTTEHLDFIAKLAVIRSDFPDFYVELERNPGILEYIEQVLSEQEIADHQRVMVDKFTKGTIYQLFEDTEIANVNHKEIKVNPKNASLVRYLKRTSHIQVSDIRPFLYFKADKTRFIIKDESYRTLAADITSGNLKSVEYALEHSADNGVALFEFALDILDVMSDLDLYKGLSVIYALSEALKNMPKDLAERVANFVVKNHSALKGVTLSDPYKVFILVDHASDITMRDQFILERFKYLEKEGSSGLITIPWVREMMQRQDILDLNKDIYSVVQIAKAELDSEDIVQLCEGVNITKQIVEFIGEDEMYALFDAALEIDENEAEDKSLVKFTDKILPYVIEVFPEKMVEVLTNFIERGNDLLHSTSNYINDFEGWLQNEEVLPILKASCKRYDELDSNELSEFLAWTHQCVENSNSKQDAQMEVLNFMARNLSVEDKNSLQALFEHYRKIRPVYESDIWGDFDTQLSESAILSIGTERNEVLRRWVLTAFDNFSKDTKDEFNDRVNSLLHDPESLNHARFARMVVVENLNQNRTITVRISEWCETLTNTDYARVVRNEIALALISVYPRIGSEYKIQICSSLISGLLTQSDVEEVRLAMNLFEQLNWPLPEGVADELINGLFTRLPSIGNDTELWSKSIEILYRLIDALDEGQLEQYYKWLIKHLERDAIVATKYALRDWESIGLAKRVQITDYLMENNKDISIREKILTNWNLSSKQLNNDEVKEQFEEIFQWDFSDESLELLSSQIINALPIRVVKDVVQETMNRVIEDETERENWIKISSLCMKRLGNNVDSSRMFSHLLTGGATDRNLGIKYLPKARHQLTVEEELALEKSLSDLIKAIPMKEFPDVVRTVRKVSGNKLLLDHIYDRWELEKKSLNVKNKDLANEIRDSLNGIKRKRWGKLTNR